MGRQFEVNRAARAARRGKRSTVKSGHIQTAKSGERVVLETTREVSPEQAEACEFVAQLARHYVSVIEYHKAEEMGGLSHAEAVNKMEAQKARWSEAALKKHPSDVTWTELASLGESDLRASLGVWGRVREAADDELMSGQRAARAIGDSSSPFARAQFFAIRDAFADEWKPRGGIESALIDMMAVAFSLQMYWTAIVHQRATNTFNEQRALLRKYESDGWKSPYQSEADATEQAHRFADGYNRQFLRVLRQMRDLRRYPSVIVNNGGQVNVAHNQVNAQQAG